MKRLKLLIPLGLLTLFIIAFLWMLFSTSKIETVIDRIKEKGGAVQTRTIFPIWVDSYLPNVFSRKLQRPYAVWLPSAFGDKELSEILEIEGLTSITASGTAITENSLNRLAEYKGLELLYIGNCNISREKLKWLEKQLPATSVIY